MNDLLHFLDQEGDVHSLRQIPVDLLRQGLQGVVQIVEVVHMPVGAISLSHSDSPTFRIKENAELAGPEGYLRLNTERYGGMLCAPWMDRPLTVAGRVLARAGEGIETKLVYVDRDLLMSPAPGRRRPARPRPPGRCRRLPAW